MRYGTVTFWIEGCDIDEATERILKAVEDACPDIPYSATEDVGEYDEASA